MILICQIKTGRQWDDLGVAEALESNREEMRCPECHGPVCAHKEYNNGVAAHFEHKVAHKGCRLIPSNFNGHSSLHPGALE
jgi:hypothetical protein